MPNELGEGTKDYLGTEDDDGNDAEYNTPFEVKHDLLHFLTADMLYSLQVKKRFSVL